jgi:hypothetical protein
MHTPTGRIVGLEALPVLFTHIFNTTPERRKIYVYPVLQFIQVTVEEDE